MNQSRENIYSLKGFGKVFRFTLIQTLKNKGFILTAVMMILMMAFMKPMMYGFSKSGSNVAKKALSTSLSEIEAEKLYIYNETDYSMDMSHVTPDTGNPQEKGLKIENVKVYNKSESSEENLIKELGAKDILVVIRAEARKYMVNAIVSDSSEVAVKSMDSAAEYTREAFEGARKDQMKLDPETLQSLNSGISTGSVLTESEMHAEEEKSMSTREFGAIIMGFALIIMLVSSLSSSYIISSVNEEKSSKLAESLLVSVRPMALLMGKIIGMLSFVIGTILLGVIGSTIADYIMENVVHADMSIVNSTAGINLGIFTSYGVDGLIVLLVEVLFALASFGVLSGIMGAACSKTEDQQNATSVVMMLTVVGYMLCIVMGMQDKNVEILSLVPPVSYFMAPVSYIGGRINIGMLLASFAIQAVLLVGLVMLSAKTYRNLLLSDSSKPKLAAIFKAAKM